MLVKAATARASALPPDPSERTPPFRGGRKRKARNRKCPRLPRSQTLMSSYFEPIQSPERPSTQSSQSNQSSPSLVTGIQTRIGALDPPSIRYSALNRYVKSGGKTELTETIDNQITGLSQ